jgi:hypothetical protein
MLCDTAAHVGWKPQLMTLLQGLSTASEWNLNLIKLDLCRSCLGGSMHTLHTLRACSSYTHFVTSPHSHTHTKKGATSTQQQT